jgi:hypothetical protein
MIFGRRGAAEGAAVAELQTGANASKAVRRAVVFIFIGMQDFGEWRRIQEA